MSPENPLRTSVQLYSVREALRADMPGTVARIAEIGFTRVEGFRLSEFPALHATLTAHGLTMPSVHERVISEEDPDRWNRSFAHAASHGVKLVIDPVVAADEWEDAESIARIADRMNTAADIAAAHGVRFGYHNHAHDLARQDDGRTALDHLVDRLDDTVRLEIDVYWAIRAGVDAVALVQRLGDRVAALHLKDTPAGSREIADQVPLGLGDVPFRECVMAAPAGALQVIEFDDSRWDLFEALAQSLSRLNEAVAA